MANPIASILNMGSKVLKGAKNVGGKALDAAGRAALYSQTFNNPNEKMGMGKRIGGALFKATVMDTLGDMGTLGQAVTAGMLSRGDKSRSKKETTGGGGVGPTTISGNPIQGEDVVKAISESTQQIIRGLNILNTTFRQGLNATTNQIQAQSDVLGDIRTNTANSDNKLRDIYEQLNFLVNKNNGSKSDQQLVPLEKEGATPQSDQGSILSSLAPGLLGMLPALLKPAMGIIAGGAAAFLADMGLGYLGVGGNELDEKRDDENWDRMNWWQKIESGLARTVENVGGFIAPNIANEAASNRIAAESKYFDEQDGKIKNPNKTRAEAIQQKPPKPTDAKAINKKAVITMGEDAGKEITVLWMHNDGMYEIEYPDGKRTKAGKRTFKFLDNTSSVPGEVNVAQNTATAVASDAPSGSYYVPSEIEEDRSDLENKNELLKDFAARMGIDTSGGLTGSMQGGVPVEINGQKVPEELYTDDQKKNVEGARLIQSMMNPAGMTAEGIDSAEGNMTSGEYLANRQQQFDAQRNQTSEGLLREREKEYEASIKKMLDIVKYEAREVLFDADNIKFDAAKIEFNQSGEGGEVGDYGGGAVPGGGASNWGEQGGTESRDGSGVKPPATKVPQLSAETKTAAEQLQGGNAVRVAPGGADPLGQYSEEQLRSQNIVSHTNADGTKVYNYVPGGVGGHADKIGGSGATEAVPGQGGRAGLNENTELIDAPKTNKVMEAMGIDSRQWNAFRQGLTNIESSGGTYDIRGGSSNRFSGAYQMGGDEIAESAKALGIDAPVQMGPNGKLVASDEFLKNPELQEKLFDQYTLSHHKQLMKNPKYAAMTPEEQLGILGYAHNQGAGGASKMLRTGQIGADAFGTKGTEYIQSIGNQLEATKNQTNATAQGPTAQPPNLVAGLQGMQPANAPVSTAAGNQAPGGSGLMAQGDLENINYTSAPQTSTATAGYTGSGTSATKVSEDYVNNQFLGAADFMTGLGIWPGGENPYFSESTSGQYKFDPKGGIGIDPVHKGAGHYGFRGQLAYDISVGRMIQQAKDAGVNLSEKDAHNVVTSMRDFIREQTGGAAGGSQEQKGKLGELYGPERGRMQSGTGEAGHYRHMHYAPGSNLQRGDYNQMLQTLLTDPSALNDPRTGKPSETATRLLKDLEKANFVVKQKDGTYVRNDAMMPKQMQSALGVDKPKAKVAAAKPDVTPPQATPLTADTAASGLSDYDPSKVSAASLGAAKFGVTPESKKRMIDQNKANQAASTPPSVATPAQLDQVFKNDVTAPAGSANFGNQMSAQQPPVPATPVEPNREAAAAAAVPEMSRKSALADAESKKQGPVVQNFNNTNAPKSDMISNDGVNKNSPKVAITDHMDKHLSYLFGAAA